jgi:predicted acyltransferase
MSATKTTKGDTRNRAYALDALRGIAILMMIFSGVIPFGVLPSWMYHAQTPPPSHVWNGNLPGITWVDLVFPFFLFSMGAAIPLALAKRVEQGTHWWKLVYQILVRGALLGGFAVYIQHIRPYTISSEPTKTTWLLSLLGFALLFPVLIRLPDSWDRLSKFMVKAVGWIGAVVLLLYVCYPHKSLLALRYADLRAIPYQGTDIIIILLANMAVFGSLIWLITRENLFLRLGFMGIMMAIRLSAPAHGWVEVLDGKSPIPWLYQLGYLQYLHIVIPGTIVGDIVLRWMCAQDAEPGKRNWPALRLAGTVLLMLSTAVVMVIGLKERWLWQTTVAGFGMCGLGWLLMRNPVTSTEKLLKDLFSWGAFWLVLGLIFEPYEGGIKKDDATMSYYFVTSGLAIFMLIAFTIVIDIFRKRRWLQLLIDNGQNPMVAYAGEGNLILPILALTGLGAVIEAHTQGPWPGVARGALITLLIALSVSLCTRLKVYWRT